MDRMQHILFVGRVPGASCAGRSRIPISCRPISAWACWRHIRDSLQLHIAMLVNLPPI
jgi:hypothetical protein